MSAFSAKVNEVRRIIMRKITRRIGASTHSDLESFYEKEALHVKKILVSRPNSRLGNQLLMLPLVESLEKLFPNAKIDLFTRGGVTPIIFENYSCIDKYIRLPKKPFKELGKYLKVWQGIRSVKYDIAINLAANSSSGRISVDISKARVKIFNNEVEELAIRYDDYKHIAKFPVYNLLYALGLLADDASHPAIPPMDIRLTETELKTGRDILDKVVDPSKETIAIYTFATGAKCYSPDWWNPLYEQMVQKYGAQYNILEVLPVENISQIEFKAPSYYSKDIREMAALIANASVFITADCGIMHLGSATTTSVIGLFSVTTSKTYGPYNNLSVSINTNESNNTDILSSIDRVLEKQ